MSDRYSTIQKIDRKYWNEKCPVLVIRGALLYDNYKEKYLIQLKFRNTSNKQIIAFVVHISCYPVGKKDVCESLDYQFLDLKVNKNDEFGDDKAIYIESNNARSFNFAIKEIVYSDSFTDNTIYDLVCIPSVQSTEILGDKEEAFKSLVPGAVYLPLFNKDYWICTCGEINAIDTKCCHVCNRDEDVLRSSISEEKLIERQLSIKQEREEKKREEERLREETEKERIAIKQKKKNTRKRITRILVSSILVFIIAFLIKRYIPDFVKYSIAVYRLNETNDDKNIVDAVNSLIELGDYLDSSRRVELASDQFYLSQTYLNAENLAEQGNLVEAIHLYEQILDYKDSSEKVRKFYIELAEDALRRSSFKEAIGYWELAGECSSERYYEACYYEAVSQMEKAQNSIYPFDCYYMANVYFDKINNIDYKDADELKKQCEDVLNDYNDYLSVIGLLREANIAEAQDKLLQLPEDFLQTSELLDICNGDILGYYYPVDDKKAKFVYVLIELSMDYNLSADIKLVARYRFNSSNGLYIWDVDDVLNYSLDNGFEADWHHSDVDYCMDENYNFITIDKSIDYSLNINENGYGTLTYSMVSDGVVSLEKYYKG